MSFDWERAHSNWAKGWSLPKAKAVSKEVIVPDVLIGIVKNATANNLTNIQIANGLARYDIKVSDLPLRSWAHPDLDADATTVIESLRKQVFSVNPKSSSQLYKAIIVSELVSHSGIEFIVQPPKPTYNKPKFSVKRQRHSQRRARGKSIQVHGVLGSAGGTYISLPKAIQFLTHITTFDGTYSEVASNQILNSALETVFNSGFEFVINDVLPLSILTSICHALFGKKTVIDAIDAIVLVAISQMEPKTIANLLVEQSKRLRFLELDILDEYALDIVLTKLIEQKLISIEGDRIKLSQVVVQIN
ncbi:TPA: hypothetical protein NJ316_004184 [Vibrio parahaemolyticus]|nr:hypothetical protein [Vibrio parahaemolyticus]